MAIIKFTDYIDIDELLDMAVLEYKSELKDYMYDVVDVYETSQAQFVELMSKKPNHVNSFFTNLVSDFVDDWTDSTNSGTRKRFKKLQPFLDVCKDANMSFVIPNPKPKFIFRGTELKSATVQFIKRSDISKWKMYKDFMYYSAKKISYKSSSDVQSWTTNPTTALDFSQNHQYGGVMATNYELDTTYFSPKFIAKLFGNGAGEDEVISSKKQYSVLLMVEHTTFSEIRNTQTTKYKDTDKEIGNIFKGFGK